MPKNNTFFKNKLAFPGKCGYNKIANDKDITTDIVYAICNALEVTPNDIMEYVPDK